MTFVQAAWPIYSSLSYNAAIVIRHHYDVIPYLKAFLKVPRVHRILLLIVSEFPLEVQDQLVHPGDLCGELLGIQPFARPTYDWKQANIAAALQDNFRGCGLGLVINSRLRKELGLFSCPTRKYLSWYNRNRHIARSRNRLAC